MQQIGDALIVADIGAGTGQVGRLFTEKYETAVTFGRPLLSNGDGMNNYLRLIDTNKYGRHTL